MTNSTILATENLQQFVGGEMEVHGGSCCRGPIESIKIENDHLIITLKWFAQGDGPVPTRWKLRENPGDIAFSLEMPFGCRITDIGNGRLSVQHPLISEMTILFPKDGSHLDPSQVEGLASASA